MPTDKIFYSLFQEFPSIFFELIGATFVDANAYEFASVELKETAFRIDGVFVPRPAPSAQPVYFLEVQFQQDAEFYRRFFAEIFIYLHQNPSVKSWRAAVIYPTRSIETDDVEPYELLLASTQVQRIYLDELGEAAESSLGVAIVQLVVESEATAVQRGRELILQARQELADDINRQKILDIIETILLYKFTRLSREELAKMLGIDDEFRQTRMYQSIKQEGLEEGRQEGLEEGEMRAKLQAVSPLLALGLSVEQIAGALGLTVEQVREAAQNQPS